MSNLKPTTSKEPDLYDPYVTAKDCPIIDYPSGRLGAITRKRGEIEVFFKESKNEENVALVCELRTELEAKISNFVEYCKLQETKDGITEQDLADFTSWKDSHVTIGRKFQAKIENWLATKPTSGDDINPEDSASQVEDSQLSKKSGSSLRSHKASLIERKIKLEMKQKKSEEETALEEKSIEVKLQHEKLLLQLKREKDNLAVKFEKEEIDRISKELSVIDRKSNLKSKKSSKLEQGFGPQTNEPQVSTLQSYPFPNALSHLPRHEPDTFDGEITSYKPFTLAFDQTIAQLCHKDVDRYYYLQRYTKGYPLELVKSCLCDDMSKSYNDARMILHKYYGNEIILAQKYIDKLDNWSPIKSEDSKALDEFALYLTTCANMMNNSCYLNQLNSWKEIKNILMKLPYDIRKQFRNKVAAEQDKGNIITFHSLVKFVQYQAQSLKLPLFGDIRDPSHNNKSKPTNSLKPKYEKVYATFEPKTDLQYKLPAKSNPCICCGKDNHCLDDCFFFLQKTIENREDFIKSKKLCFGCLKYSNHRSKDCKLRLTCKKCGKSHPTSLHKERKEDRTHVMRASYNPKWQPTETETLPQAQAFRARTSTANERVVCPSVPVGIRVNNSDQIIVTNMAMDTYSTGCYMDEGLLNLLNITGKNSVLSLTTMENSSSFVPVKIVENLEIISLVDKESIIIPKLYAKSKWPFEPNDTVTENDIKNFPALKNLPFNFVSERIGLLVGINMPEIVRPLEVVNTTNKGPYASRHLFGWALNGPVTGSKHTNVSCFRTVVRSEKTETLDDKIENYFARDFEDKYDETKLSIDDQKWQNKVSNGLKKLPENKFEVPLSARSTNST